MILYHAVSSYQLLVLLLHKKKFYPDTPCVILISNWLVDKFPNYRELLASFQQILICNPHIVLSKGESFQSGTKKYYDEIFKTHGLSIEKFNEIYVGGAHYSFGIYLTENKIPFIFLEDAAGMVSRDDLLKKIDSKFPSKSKKCEENGLYNGNSPYIKKILCNTKVQLSDFNIYDERIVHINPVELLQDLSSEDLAHIMRMFHIEQKLEGMDGKSILLLTQHFSNLRILSFEDHALIYQIFMDYFTSGAAVLIKPHPDDIMFYSLLFPEASIIKERFPSEFLPFIFNKKPQSIATVSSTAIFSIADAFDQKIEFSPSYESYFHYTHRAYIALDYLSHQQTDVEIQVFGSDMNLIHNLAKFSDLKDRHLLITPITNADEIDWNKKIMIDRVADYDCFSDPEQFNNYFHSLYSENKIGGEIVFLNTQDDFCFYKTLDHSVWRSVIPITIYKRWLEDDYIYENNQQETIYYLTTNERRRTDMMGKAVSKELKHTKVQISTEQLSESELKIKVLEGTLRATENRLLYYIEKVKELESQAK